MPTFASSFGATACGTATESLLSALLEIKLRLLPELDAVCPPSRRQIGPSSYDLHRFRSSNHILSAWARREERAFAHPTDWFHGIGPLGYMHLACEMIRGQALLRQKLGN